MFGHGILAGYKTYILGGMIVLTALANFLVGDSSLQQVLQATWEGLVGMGLISLRAGISNMGAKQ